MNAELSQVLADLAQQFGTTVPHLWAVMLRQARVEAIVGLVYFAIVVAAVVGYAFWLPRIRHAWGDGLLDKGATLHAVGGLVCAVLLLAMVFVGLLGINDVVTALVNPEFFAIRQVLEAL